MATDRRKHQPLVIDFTALREKLATCDFFRVRLSVVGWIDRRMARFYRRIFISGNEDRLSVHDNAAFYLIADRRHAIIPREE